VKGSGSKTAALDVEQQRILTVKCEIQRNVDFGHPAERRITEAAPKINLWELFLFING